MTRPVVTLQPVLDKTRAAGGIARLEKAMDPLVRGVWAPIFAHTPARRLPSIWCSRSTVSVSRANVPLARMNTARASTRSTSSASASTKGLPKTTLSIAGNR